MATSSLFSFYIPHKNLLFDLLFSCLSEDIVFSMLIKTPLENKLCAVSLWKINSLEHIKIMINVQTWLNGKKCCSTLCGSFPQKNS